MLPMVGEMGPEAEKPISEVRSEVKTFVVAAVAEACWQNCSKVGGNSWDSGGLGGGGGSSWVAADS